MSRDHSTEMCTYGNVKFRCTPDGTIQIKLVDDPPTKRWANINKLATFESISLYAALRLLNHQTFLCGLQTHAVNNMLDAIIADDEIPNDLREEYYEIWGLHQKKEELYQDHVMAATNPTEAEPVQKVSDSGNARSVESSPPKRRKMTAAKGVGTFKPPAPKIVYNAGTQTKDVLFCEPAKEVFVYLEDLTDYRYSDVNLKKIYDSKVCDEMYDAMSRLAPHVITKANCGDLPFYKAVMSEEYVTKTFEELATKESLRTTSNAYGRISCKVRGYFMGNPKITRIGVMTRCISALEQAMYGARCERADLIANLVINDFLVWFQQRFHGFSTVEVNIIGHMFHRIANAVNKPKNPNLYKVPTVDFYDLKMFQPLAKLHLKREREARKREARERKARKASS